MMKHLFATAALSLALAASPSSAQLLGGGGAGSLGGSLGGVGGMGAGMGGGQLGGMIERGPTRGSLDKATRATTRSERRVDTRRGRVGASGAASGDSALSGTLCRGDRAVDAGGALSGNVGGGADAELIGTDAVRGAANRGAEATRSAVGRTRSALGETVSRGRGAAEGAVGSIGGAANADGNASGSAGGAAGNGALSGNLALAGSGAAEGGAFPVSPGMIVRDGAGRAIGTVRSVKSSADGAVDRVLVRVGDRTANLPAANFSGSGSALVSAMGQGEVSKSAR